MLLGIDRFGYLTDELSGMGFYVRSISPEGYRRIKDLRVPNSESRQAFVAMWFSEEMTAVFSDGIKPAVQSAGFVAHRVDLTPHNQKIDDQIIADIRASRFVIADFTGERGGVYFEAGFAFGLGLPVIWMIRQGFESTLHFDTRQYNHIVWKDAEDLKQKLTVRIRATIPGSRLQ